MVITGAVKRTKLQSNSHHKQTNTSTLQYRQPLCHPTNNVRALKENLSIKHILLSSNPLMLYDGFV